MQHETPIKPCALSKMELFVTKNRQWLEIVVDCCYKRYVTGLQDLTLKDIDKFRLRQQSILSAIYIFKVSKKYTRT